MSPVHVLRRTVSALRRTPSPRRKLPAMATNGDEAALAPLFRKRKSEDKPAAAMSTKKPVKAANSWQDGLLRYLRDPASLPASEVYQHDNDTVTIYDGFPKATVHLLLMPRRLVNSVVDLRNDKEDLALLDLLTARAEDITKGLREKHPGLAFRAGLHAVPSMRQLHVHIISQDFVSPSLKNKKHWNSFTTAFFVDLATVRGKLITDGAVKFDTIAYEELLKQPLRCNQCSQTAPNMPKLKAHLERHLAQR